MLTVLTAIYNNSDEKDEYREWAITLSRVIPILIGTYTHYKHS